MQEKLCEAQGAKGDASSTDHSGQSIPVRAFRQFGPQQAGDDHGNETAHERGKTDQ